MMLTAAGQLSEDSEILRTQMDAFLNEVRAA